jgi:hypothetical protein
MLSLSHVGKLKILEIIENNSNAARSPITKIMTRDTLGELATIARQPARIKSHSVETAVKVGSLYCAEARLAAASTVTAVNVEANANSATGNR